MSGRFMIEHKDGREYGLEGARGVKAFKEIYEPQGFKIAKQQPNYGEPWEAPDIPDDDAPAETPAKAAKAEKAA